MESCSSIIERKRWNGDFLPLNWEQESPFFCMIARWKKNGKTAPCTIPQRHPFSPLSVFNTPMQQGALRRHFRNNIFLKILPDSWIKTDETTSLCLSFMNACNPTPCVSHGYHFSEKPPKKKKIIGFYHRSHRCTPIFYFVFQ